VTTLTTKLSLRKGVDSDNAEVYLTTDLGATLDILDEAILTSAVGTVTATMMANRTRRRFIPAGAFQATAGAPSFTSTHGGSWLLDAASTETVSSSCAVPEDWDSGAISFILVLAPVTSGSVGSREVDITLTTSLCSDGAVPTTASTTDTISTNATSEGQTHATHSRTVTPASVNQYLGISISRIGANVPDDLAGDVRFAGMWISYTADG